MNITLFLTGIWASNEYVNNGSTYSLDTDLIFFNDDIDSVQFKGQTFIPNYSTTYGYKNNLLAAGYNNVARYNSWGLTIGARQNGFLSSRVLYHSSNYAISAVPNSIVTQTVVDFDYTGYSNGNFAGTIITTPFTYTQPDTTTATEFLHNISYLRFNYGDATNGQIRCNRLITKNSNNEITHTLYPAKTLINNVETYGLYDTYGGGFYYLNGVNFNINSYGQVSDFNSSSFGNVLTGNDIPANNNNWYTDPTILNSDSSLETWDFEYLTISSGSILSNSDGQTDNVFILYQDYNNTTNPLNLDKYKTVFQDGTCQFNIPRNDLLGTNSIVSGRSFSFSLWVLDYSASPHAHTYTLGTYIFDLTQEQQDNINNDRAQNGLTNISNEQQQTTNSINNLSNSINDDNVSNSSIQQPDVPIDSSGVISGVDNIFTVIMNAFTEFDSSQQIVFPIPFTNQNIVLSGNYVRDMLTSVNASWVINIITAFWWYIIARFIIKDILRSVEKIQTGDVENIENNNIKGDML